MRIFLSVSFILLLLQLFAASQTVAQSNCNPCSEPENRYVDQVYALKDVVRIQNIEFIKEGAANPQYLDFYSSLGNDCESRPLIIFLPGSGFLLSGDPRNTLFSIYVGKYFASRGYAVAVVNYRRAYSKNVNNSDKFYSVVNEAAQDVNAAIHFFVSSNVLDPGLNLDPQNIFIIGESAGGIAGLSALFSDVNGNLLHNEIPWALPSGVQSPVSLTAKSRALLEDYTIRAFAGISTGVPTKGVFTNRSRNIDLPMMFVHSNSDHVVPFDENYPNVASIFPLLPSLPKKFCGSGCIKNEIIINRSSNCYKLNEVRSSSHDLMSTIYREPYLSQINDFFNDQLNCNSCKSYHKGPYPHPAPSSVPSVRRKKEQSLTETVAGHKLIMYPNPSDNFIYIQGLPNDNTAEIIIYDLMGKEVMVKGNHEEAESIDISSLSSGIYIVQITSEETREVMKITKR